MEDGHTYEKIVELYRYCWCSPGPISSQDALLSLTGEEADSDQAATQPGSHKEKEGHPESRAASW